jgi:hypothetical protein
MGWATYIEEVQLVSCASNGVCKEEDVSLQPGDFIGRILETNSWTRHFEYGCIKKDSIEM